MAYRHRHTVRFGEVDYAGIVYYPNFFDYFQQTEEEFMASLGYPYHQLLGELKIGFPIVHAEADFKEPVRYGEVLEIELVVRRIGERSVTFGFEARRQTDGRLCATASITHALVDFQRFKNENSGPRPETVAIPLPAEMRRRFEAHRA